MTRSGLPAVSHEAVGIGGTDALNLRVSVGVLVRVLFRHPHTGAWMLALERKATLYKEEEVNRITVSAQPFGGAVRILDVHALRNVIGEFNFDSHRSQAERDFRLFIRPEVWPHLRAFCLAHLSPDAGLVLDSDPGRELREEFHDTLGVELQADQYTCTPVGLAVQGSPQVTSNPRARGYPTARIYRLFEAVITDPVVGQALIENSSGQSDRDVRAKAEQDAQVGGKGRANAVLALPVAALRAFYISLALEDRNAPVIFEGHRLEETVPLVLEGVEIPKYVRG